MYCQALFWFVFLVLKHQFFFREQWHLVAERQYSSQARVRWKQWLSYMLVNVYNYYLQQKYQFIHKWWKCTGSHQISTWTLEMCVISRNQCVWQKKTHIFCVSVEGIASNLNANILRSSSGGQPLWRHWCISALSHLMNLNLGSDESSHYWVLLLIHLPYTYCLQWASLLPEEPASLRPGAKRLLQRGGGDAGSNAVAQEAQPRLRCGDKKRGGGRLPHCTPYLHISLFP